MSQLRSIERLYQRVSRAFGVGRTTTAPDASGNVATMQVSLNPMETLDAQMLVQHFGFSSSPPTGTQVFMAFLGGDRSNGVIIGTTHPSYRPRGQAPGATIVHDQAGSQVALPNDGTIVLVPTGGVVRIVGDLHVTGNIVWTCDSAPTDAEGHVHGGVMSGGANTSAPVAGS